MVGGGERWGAAVNTELLLLVTDSLSGAVRRIRRWGFGGEKKMIPLTFLVQPEPGESGAASGLPHVQKTRRAEQGCVRTALPIRHV